MEIKNHCNEFTKHSCQTVSNCAAQLFGEMLVISSDTGKYLLLLSDW